MISIGHLREGHTRMLQAGRTCAAALTCTAFICFPVCGFSLQAQSAIQTPAQQQSAGLADVVSGLPDQATVARKKTREDRRAEDAYISGARLVERQDLAGAEHHFARAVELAPQNGVYAMALASVREGHVTELVQAAGKARLLGDNAAAESLLAQARTIDPNNSILLQHPAPGTSAASNKLRSWLPNGIVDGPRLAPPIVLRPAAGTKSFQIHSSVTEVVRQVVEAYGLKASIDTSVGTKQIKFDLDNVTYAQAMHVLAQMGQILATPLTPASVLVAKDTPENRQKYEHLVQETIYAAGLTSEQIAEIGSMIKNVFGVRQISMESTFASFVIRAPEETLRALNITLADLIDGGSQVMFDLKVYSVANSKTTNIGATLPNQAGAYNAYTEATQLVQANQTIVDQAIAQGVIPAGASNIAIALALINAGLATSSLLSNTLVFFGGGHTFSGLYTDANSAINLSLTASDTRALDEVQLRVGDHQSATFRAGSKYPITQSTYSTTAPTAISSALAGASVNGVSLSSLLGSATTSTVPQVQYEDLGVTLKATPTVQKSGLIAVHLELKIESLAGGTVDNIPILDSDQLTSDVTIPDGGTAFLVSNMTRSQAAAVTGVPGLSELPGFQNTPEIQKTTNVAQLLMVLTPHLVRLRPGTGSGPAIPIGASANTSE